MKQKREIALLFILALLFSVYGPKDTICAETQTKVYITEGTLNHALNRTMNVGEMRSGWKIELNNKRTAKSVQWVSSTVPI